MNILGHYEAFYDSLWQERRFFRQAVSLSNHAQSPPGPTVSSAFGTHSLSFSFSLLRKQNPTLSEGGRLRKSWWLTSMMGFGQEGTGDKNCTTICHKYGHCDWKEPIVTWHCRHSNWLFVCYFLTIMLKVKKITSHSRWWHLAPVSMGVTTTNWFKLKMKQWISSKKWLKQILPYSNPLSIDVEGRNRYW